MRTYAANELNAIVGIHKEARRLALEEAKAACERQIEIFLSPEYAVGQPMSSVQERFGVLKCIEAIEDLLSADENHV